MFLERLLRHRAMRFCALICLSLLLLAFICAPIHKHDTGRDASCLFCHATTRAEWQLPTSTTVERPAAASVSLIDRYAGHAFTDDAELTVRIPRAPPSSLLAL